MHEPGPQGGNEAATFGHDMIREVVYVEAGETRTRIFHRRAFHTLQNAAVPPAKLAYHARSAGVLESAFRLSVAAGDEAAAVFALQDAISHYEQALRLLAEQPTGRTLQGKLSASELQHLCASLGRVCELTRGWEQARPLYGATLKQVLAMQEDDAIRQEKTQWYQTMINLYLADLAVAITHAERALALARSLGQADLTAQSLTALTSIKMQRGEWEESEKLIAEAHMLYVALRDRAMEADSLALLANTHRHLGRPQAGIMRARNALTINQDIENVWGQVHAISELTSGLLDIGAYTEALEMALQAVTRAHMLGAHSSWARTMLLRSLLQLGAVYREMQALHAAREVDLEALHLNGAMVEQSHTAVVTAALCADYSLLGNWADAYRYARQASTIAGSNVLSYAGIPQWCITKALLRGGEDIVLAQEHLDRLGTRIGDDRRARIEYLQASAEFAWWEGHQEQALASLEEARDLSEKIGLPGELWHVQAALGDLYQSRGEQTPANQAFAQAATVVQELVGKTEDEALRTSFLTASQVQRVLEQGAH